MSADRKPEVDEDTAPLNGVMSWSIYEDELKAELNMTNKQEPKLNE